MSIIVKILLWLIANCLTFLVSVRITALSRAHSRSMTLALFIFWWLFLNIAIVMILGMNCLLNVWAVLLLALGIAIFSGACSSENIRFTADYLRDVYHSFKELVIAYPLYSIIWMLMAAVILARMWLFVWVLPPHVYDVLTYHLPKVADWIQDGGLTIHDTPVDRSFWPASFELLQVWFVLFWHHDVIIEAAGIPFYLLAVVSVYCLARSLNVRRVYAAWSAMLYASTPVVIMNAVSCKNDMPLGALLILIAVLLVSIHVEKSNARSHVLMLVAIVGLGVGIKALMLFVFPVIAIVLMIGAWRRREEVFSGFSRGELMAWSVILCTAVLLAGYWYIRNSLVFNNPTYPVPLKLFGHEMQGIGGLQQGKFSMNSMGENFKALWERRLWDKGPYDPDACLVTGWGWYVAGVGLMASLFAMYVNKVYRWLWILFALCFCIVLGFVTPDPWNMRFVQWYPAVMCVALGVALQNLQFDISRRSLLLLATLCGLMNLAGSLNNGWFSRDDWKKHIAIPLREKSIQEVYKIINQRVPRGEPLAYIVGGNDPVYCLYGPYMDRKIRFIRCGGIGFWLEHPEFRKLVVQAGCRYFYFPKGEEGAIRRKLFSGEVESGKFIDLGGDVYKVSYEK